MSSIPSYSMESLLLRVKVSCLLLFTEKSYKGFKIVEILKKGYNIKNAPSRIRTRTARELSLIDVVTDALTNLATEVLYLKVQILRLMNLMAI